MSEKTVIRQGFNWFWPLCFWTFIIIKVSGSYFATWSWWWCLLPPVPTISLVLDKLGWLV